jgi:1-acyl-sn-glycerol-3-phosphate acyltransferase
MNPYKVPLINHFARTTFRPVFRLLFYLLSNVKITGMENVPKGGAYMITMNHVSLYDPPFLLSFWPVAPEAVGAIDIWRKPGQNILALAYGAIPLHRGEYDRQVLDMMIAVLKSGYPLLLAPEGRRSHTGGMQRALPGVAYIVEKTGVAVIPVGVVGTTDDFIRQALRLQRPKVEIRIGKPLILPPVSGAGTARRESLQANVDGIMLAIASLLPPEYRGVYQIPGETA